MADVSQKQKEREANLRALAGRIEFREDRRPFHADAHRECLAAGARSGAHSRSSRSASRNLEIARSRKSSALFVIDAAAKLAAEIIRVAKFYDRVFEASRW